MINVYLILPSQVWFCTFVLWNRSAKPVITVEIEV